MSRGRPDRPLRVAVVGSGPTGFYTAQHLLGRESPSVEVDLFDRLPTPFGLVRFGVAPDHQKIKSVTNLYTKTAALPGFRYYGGVDVGLDVSVEEMRGFYDQIVYCTGAQTDRRLGIPGEDLAGSHTATEFVAWYNGHPDYVGREFDLSADTVVIVGVGNVAVDVARILCRSHEELAKTDIADHALRSLERSNVRRVVMLGRRGAAQAAFTNAEIKELGKMEAACTSVIAAEAQPDEWTVARLEAEPDKMLTRKLDLIAELADRDEPEKPKRLEIRFLVSPKEILGNAEGHVVGALLERNRLEERDGGYLASVGTGKVERVDAGLVFRSVGYRGVPIPGVPFDTRSALVPNERGRVLTATGGEVVPGEYCAGWIKRGPRGVIGTNKPDALETVECMIEDAEAGRLLPAGEGDAAAREAWLREKCPGLFTWDDWTRLDAAERSAGEAGGRPRVKLVTVEKMREVAKSTRTP